MTSTRFRMIGVALFVVALTALEAYQWDGGPEDKTKITACVGGSASFPWSIVTGQDILNLDWWFQAPDKEKTQIATYESKHFYATDNTRVAFLSNAGLSLRDARPQDSGDYSVEMEIQQANASRGSVTRTVTLCVSDRPPATQDGAFHVTLSDAIKDDVTEDWTLQLHCGQFVDLGHPPIDVFWKTPSGRLRDSSYEDNGTFVLSLSSPVQTGSYSCHLPPSTARCLSATSPLNAAAQLYVDDKDVRLSFLEARQGELEQVIEDQENLLENQTNLLRRQALQISQQNGTIEEMEADHLNLTTTVNDILTRINHANCMEWLKLNPHSGIRNVYISGEPITVYCDQTTDNGGWIVFQRRQDASVDFYRDWAEYRNGFGDPEGNFWLGLDKLHRLTTSQRYELRVDLHKWDGTKGSATYSGFYVEDVSHNFTLHFDKFTGGNAGDSLTYHRGGQFSTKDRDHDTDRRNCAQRLHGAWWFKTCHHSNLNGDHKTSSWAPNVDGICWITFGVSTYSMKFAEMKIRPI